VHLDGRDVSRLPLIERKALLEPLVAYQPGLQFNGHETVGGELILRHAGKLAFEGVVSKTIDARPTRLEIAAYGANQNGSIAKSSSSSAGPTRKERALILERCSSATGRTTPSSSMPAAWAQECRSKFSPICDAA
jgi:hypothetical protein